MKGSVVNGISMPDANWLIDYRVKFDMCQSDIAAALCFLLRRPINQGRIAEIETGQRCLDPQWRAALVRFFNYVEAKKASGKDWRDGLFS